MKEMETKTHAELKHAEVTKNQILLYILGKTLKANDMFLSQAVAADDSTLRLHAQLSLIA
jgi:hypothetical protein